MNAATSEEIVCEYFDNGEYIKSEKDSKIFEQKQWLSKEYVMGLAHCIQGYPHNCSRHPKDCDLIIQVDDIKKKKYACICGKIMKFRGFCSKKCHDEYYDKMEGQ